MKNRKETSRDLIYILQLDNLCNVMLKITAYWFLIRKPHNFAFCFKNKC